MEYKSRGAHSFFASSPLENAKAKRFDQLDQKNSIPSGTNHHKSPYVAFPSKPPNKRYREPIQVKEWYARATGGSLLVERRFHWTDTE